MGSWYTVREDDDMMSIARQFGFRNWRTIYDHPDNEGLRRVRTDPFMLFKGDEIWIPDKNPKAYSCETNRRHTFTLPSPRMHVKLVLADDSGKPFSRLKYEIWINGRRFGNEERRTSQDGQISDEVPFAREVELRLWMDAAKEDDSEAYTPYVLQFGHLDPIDTIEGVQDRLVGLGYDCKDEHGTLGPKTQAAIRAFQSKEFGSSAATGEIDLRRPDDPTRKKLVELYGR